MRFLFSLLMTCGLIMQSGCTSMTSTMLTRDEGNHSWTRKGNLKGVPITLKVPTHVQLTIYETHYIVKGLNGAQRIPLPFVVRDFSQEFIYSEKIFTVDFKRPAAGPSNLHLGLTDDQYIAKFEHDVTDQTIQQVTTLVGQFFPKGLFSPAASDTGGATPPEEAFREIRSVVAVDMFEIDAPDFEEQMCAFVNCHLNQWHDAWVAPVKVLNRTGLVGVDPCVEDIESPRPVASAGEPRSQPSAPPTRVPPLPQPQAKAAPSAEPNRGRQVK